MALWSGWKRMGLLVAGVVIAVVAGELAVRLTRMDYVMLSRSLYYQNSNVDVYRVSDDPVLHFELAPGAVSHGRGPWGNAWTCTIDEYGARGGPHALQPAEDTLRILFFGASTIFGANVDDRETLPARLELALGQRLDGMPVEVWNFGNSGYVLAQLLRLARLKLRQIPQVDLLLLMNTNSGRRTFLGGEGALTRDRARFFRQDPWCFPENFPPPPGMPDGLYGALAHGALYRYFVGWSWSRRHSPRGNNPYVDAVTRQEWIALEGEAAAAGVPWVFAFYPRKNAGSTPYIPFSIPDGRGLDLQRTSDDPLFYEIHPPPRYLAQHAEHLADLLLEQGIVPAGSALNPRSR